MTLKPKQTVEEAFIEEALFARLTSALETHIFSKGNRVDEWPADEAAAYRDNGGFMEGRAAVQELRIQKVATELLPLVKQSQGE